MKEYLVKIPEGEEEMLVAVMEKFGAEVEAIQKGSAEKASIKKNKSSAMLKAGKEVEEKKVSPTWLFGKWKDIDIDPVTFRKQVWRRK